MREPVAAMSRARLLVRSATLLAATVVIGAVVATGIATMAPGTVQGAAASAVRQPEDPAPRCTVPAHTKETVVVAVVADFGGANGKVIVTCVAVKAGDNDAQALQAQAALLRYPSPRYGESGLLCAIDGYPATGCGNQSGGHYAYWSYWHGGKRWLYASGGPAEWKVSKGDVEGWRFEPDGSATPADPPPRAAPSAPALENQAKGVTVSTLASSGHGAGPISSSPSSGKGTSPALFAVGTALILLIGAGALFRARRSGDRVT